MKFHSCTLQNRLYACTVVTLLFLLTLQFSLFRWIHRSPSHTTDVASRLSLKRPSGSITFIPLLLNPDQACHLSPDLVVFVTSSPGHLDRRTAIRDSWGQREHLRAHSATLLFLLGRPSNSEEQKTIEDEFKSYGDVIQADFQDAYNNLTLKSVSALKWTISHCASASFIMKTDDDIFVNVPYLLHFLQTKKEQQNLLVGCMRSHVGQPLRMASNGSMVADVKSLGGHPPFLAGAGYVISTRLVHGLYKVATSRKLFPVEDVFITAHCARALGVSVTHDERFSCGEAFRDDCAMAFKFTGHWVKPDRQRKLWNLLRRGDCGLELAHSQRNHK